MQHIITTVWKAQTATNFNRYWRRSATSLWLVLLLVTMTIKTATSEVLYEGLPTGPGLILEDRDGRIHVAVPGESGTGGVLGGQADTWEIWHQGPVQGLQVAPDGAIWLAAGEQILRYPRQGGDPVERTPSFMPQGKPGALLATRGGEVWCANCAAMRGGDALFETAPSGPEGWTITPTTEDPFGNTWAMAQNGEQRDLAVHNREYPHGWRLIGLPPEQTAGAWAGVITDGSGFLWIGLAGAALQVDPRSATGYRAFPTQVDNRITAIAPVSGGQVALGFADGSVRELTVEAEGEPQWNTVLEAGSSSVQALLHARDGGLLVLAGGTLQRTEALQATWHQYWDEQPRMPVGNHDHIFARIGDRLYTAGGKTFYGWPASEWVNLDHVWSYSINDGSWRLEPPMLEPGKAYSGIAPLDGELWLLGGLFRDPNGRHGTRPTATVEIYDPQSRTFRLGPPLPSPAGQIVGLTVGQRLYSFGGDDEQGNRSPQVLSIAAGETDWSRHTDAPGPILQASGCVLDGKVYIAAGRASNSPGLFVYDPAQDQWSQIEHPQRAPSAPMCAVFEGKIWVMGGRGADGAQTTVFAYSPESGQWERGPDLPLPVSWAAAAEVNGQLLVAGGAYEDARVGNFFNTDRVFLLRTGR